MSHNHGEAFKIMQYASDDGSVREWIWNSRDGVTPFCVTSKGGVEMTHVAWSFDVYSPGHIPQPGDRVFVDATPERARPKAFEYVDRHWDNLDFRRAFNATDKREAVEAVLKSWLSQKGTPWVITVGPGGWPKDPGLKPAPHDPYAKLFFRKADISE